MWVRGRDAQCHRHMAAERRAARLTRACGETAGLGRGVRRQGLVATVVVVPDRSRRRGVGPVVWGMLTGQRPHLRAGDGTRGVDRPQRAFAAAGHLLGGPRATDGDLRPAAGATDQPRRSGLIRRDVAGTRTFVATGPARSRRGSRARHDRDRRRSSSATESRTRPWCAASCGRQRTCSPACSPASPAGSGTGRGGATTARSSRWPRWTAGAISGSGSTVGRAVFPGASTRRQVVLPGWGAVARCAAMAR